MAYDPFHVADVDPGELLMVLGHHFGRATDIGENPVFQRDGATHSLEVRMHTRGKIDRIIPSAGFPSDEIDAIERLVAEKLVSKITPRVGQVVCFSHAPVGGTFTHGDALQVLPMPPEAPKCPWIGDFPFLLQVPYNGSADLRIDYLRKASAVNTAIRSLNVFVNHRVFWTQDSGKQAWSWCNPDGTRMKTEWVQLGYFYEGAEATLPGFSPVGQVPKIARVPDQDYFAQPHGQTMDSLTLPRCLEDGLTAIAHLSATQRACFDKAATWYYQSFDLYSISASSALVALVSAIESLVSRDKPAPSHCATCGQPQYQATQSFKDLLRAHFPLANQYQKEIQSLYRIRSALTHGQSLLQADLADTYGFLDPQGTQEGNLYRTASMIVQAVIINWLFAATGRATPVVDEIERTGKRSYFSSSGEHEG